MRVSAVTGGGFHSLRGQRRVLRAGPTLLFPPVKGRGVMTLSKTTCALNWVAGPLVFETFTLKKLECSKQAVSLEYISME